MLPVSKHTTRPHAGQMDEEVDVFAFEGEERATTRATPVALKRGKGAGAIRIVVRHQDKQGAVDSVVRLIERRAVQYGRPVLKLELAGQVAVLAPTPIWLA